MKQSLEPNEFSVRTDWGAVAFYVGVVLLILAAACVAVSWVGAFAVSDNDASNDTPAMMTTVVFAGFALPLAILGGLMTIMGLVFKRPGIRQQQRAVKNCSDCGRQNALTTKVCPRCGTRLQETAAP